MPAPIVYDGVNGGSGRDDLLFSGIKFWLALRVPSRSKFKEMIQSNGGEVVQLERHADILIADDAAPKKAPSNWDSYSWKFIAAAIEKGELPDKADYLIPRPGSGVAQASQAAKGNSKGTRTPFTAEDDRILTECARRQLSAPQSVGLKGSLKGNTFWEDFAAKNPRHTAQSWRDRWLKKLAHLPGNDEPLAAEQEESATHTGAGSTARKSGQLCPRSKSPRPESNSKVPDVSARTTKEGGRQRFTQAEDEALIKAVNEARKLGDNIGGRLFYEEFATKNPSHTAESWRSRYHRTLAPRLFPDGLLISDDQPGQIHRIVHKQRRTTEGDHSQPGRSLREHSKPQDEDPTETVDDPANPEAQTPKSIGQVESTQRYQSESQTPTTPARNGQATIRSDELDAYQIFYEFLGEYVKTRPNTINTKPCIRGVKIDLYKLQQAVESQEANLDECDWPLVCKNIGLGSLDPGLAKEVEACYRSNLQDFLEAMRGFEEGCSIVASQEPDSSIRLSTSQHDRSESDTPILDTSLLSQDEHEGSESEELLEAPSGSASSPIPRRLGKRQRSTELVNGPRKRTRLSRHAEIPDTPQVTSRFRHQTMFNDPENGNDEDGDSQSIQHSLDNTPSQQLRSELYQSSAKQNSSQISTNSHPTAGANNRITAPVAEESEPRYSGRGMLSKRCRLPAGPAATRRNKSYLDIASESSQTDSAILLRQTPAANIPPRSAQVPPTPLLSSPVKKVLDPIKEIPVRPHSVSTPRASHKPWAGRSNNMSSPLASIPNDILSDIISSSGPMRHSASFTASTVPLKRPPDVFRPSAPRNSSGSFHRQPQTILPSIEGGHDRVAISGLGEEVDRLTALGYGQRFIDKLLHATSRDVKVMKKICDMKARKTSKGYRVAPSESIPIQRGVWTKDDDEKLASIYNFDQMEDADKTAAARRSRDQNERVLKQKHGFEGVLEARRKFLLRHSETMGE